MFGKKEEILVCPGCRGSLSAAEDFLICESCRKKFPLKEGLAVLVGPADLTGHLNSQIKYFTRRACLTDLDYRLEPWQKTYLARFLENFPDVKNRLVVDLGTGSGYLALELARLGAYVVAVDLTFKNLWRLKKIAEKLGRADRIFPVCALAEKLPLRAGLADYFIANAVLEHVVEEKQAVAEINRVTKKGAGLMITGPLNYRFLNPLFGPVNLLHDKIIGHQRRYDERSFQRLLAGWETLGVYYPGHSAKVFSVLLKNIFQFKFIDEEKVEKADVRKDRQKWWASNIIAFMRKNGTPDILL